jgi:Sec-independent protein secretion pathway component TatC
MTRGYVVSCGIIAAVPVVAVSLDYFCIITRSMLAMRDNSERMLVEIDKISLSRAIGVI